MIEYGQFTTDFVEKFHEQIYTHRDLYKGKHLNVFARAKQLVEQGEVLDNILKKDLDQAHRPTPYIMANVCKMIVDTPAVLVSRSIGTITSGLEAMEKQVDDSNENTDNQIDGPTSGVKYNTDTINLQKELVANIVDRSKLKFGHKRNIVQQQMDGGLVGVPVDDDKGLRIEFKTRDLYFPHEDEMGADLAYWRDIKGESYLHVYRERVQRADGGEPSLTTKHMLYRYGAGALLEDNPMPDQEAAVLLNMRLEDLAGVYPGRSTTFIRYWANDPTLIDPLGTSAIAGQENRQDEINWTLTQTAMVFQRNGKPRLAVNKELAEGLQREMIRIYGANAKGKFDHEMLEVVSMDEKGNSMEVIQIDVSKLGGVDWVKDIIKTMLMETQTSEKAVDFYMGQTHVGAQSGVAKFYDLFLSLMKAEAIQREYIDFIKELVRDALWLANWQDKQVIIEHPHVELNNMLPIERKELIEENMAAYAPTKGKQAQSLETTIRMMNPSASDEWVEEEMARIRAENLSQDSTTSNLSLGQMTLERMLDNRDTPPLPEEPARTRGPRNKGE